MYSREYEAKLAAVAKAVNARVWKDPFRRVWLAYRPVPNLEVHLLTEGQDVPEGAECLDPQPIPINCTDEKRTQWLNGRLRRARILDGKEEVTIFDCA